MADAVDTLLGGPGLPPGTYTAAEVMEAYTDGPRDRGDMIVLLPSDGPFTIQFLDGSVVYKTTSCVLRLSKYDVWQHSVRNGYK